MPRCPMFLAVFLTLSLPLLAQAPTATINGRVLDPTKAVIPEATVDAVNIDTNVRHSTQTNAAGLFTIVNLPSGSYRVEVSKRGFRTIVKPNVVLHVQDVVALNFDMSVGSASESVTVEGGAPLVNTETAAVSTVVDRKYVENIPLNGRSLQDLILLTPGVVTNSPQGQLASAIGVSGEFSVNGQRTESNYYIVDGVSGNSGTPNAVAPYQGAFSGSLPVSSALGTTQGLVSVDALEEFRVQSSTYSAEYGRNPGGQFSFVTRSGTNQWHGVAFDYLRNDVFDANNWFNDFLQKPKPALRQNDFGGTLGGPIRIPHLYNGKNKTFFFFSYEGLRLIQPQAASINYVPTVALRQAAPSALQPVLNAFPVPNCPPSATNCSNNLGNGLGQFIGTWSNPSQVDATSVRLDHNVNTKLELFFRFSDTPSNANSRGTGAFSSPGLDSAQNYTTRTYTLGATSSLLTSLSNEFRVNYSSNRTTGSSQIDGFGGGKAVNLFDLSGINAANPSVAVVLTIGGQSPTLGQGSNSGEQRQWNVVDTLSSSLGTHQIKFGLDYRRLAPIGTPTSPLAEYIYSSAASIQANRAGTAVARAQIAAYPLYQNFSAFAQDEWRVTPRLNLSMGLRWEVNPAPGVTQGLMPYTVQGSSLSTLTLAPQGTPLWNTTWFNFAPRLGVAYVLRNVPGRETVVRGGGGLFFDTGQQNGSAGFGGPGFSAQTISIGASFPLPASQLVVPIANPPVTPYGTTVYAFPSHLQLPYTLQWNASVEQALGKSQALTVSYVGSHAGRLIEAAQVNVHAFNPNFGSVALLYNSAGKADYDALQTQFQRRLAQGLQVLGSYTWSHCLDYGSSSALFPYIRGNCDFDVRHNFSGAFSYNLPNAFENGVARAVLHHWGLDSRFTARTAFPVTLNGPNFVDPATGNTVRAGLNVVPGQPLYLYGQQYPGGRSVNPSAFTLPSGCALFSCGVNGTIGNAPRNFVRGFGAWQMDFALRREFPISERLKLQFRAEAFNIFNHPSFGLINPTYCSPGPGCTFGQATSTLAQSLGILSPLYQMGSPRSMQLALKFLF